VHRVLETLRLDSDLREQIDAQRDRLAGSLADDALARFAQGPLLARLAALREHVIARELPVLLPPESEGDGPVGFIAGAIDLLYRDPATGELVVVDYKTDRVEGAAALAERAAHYAGQAASYRRAVKEALALERPPRCELWFLHAGEVVALA
jgi:ATP-dependent exoDNAse (exonuclease V) beta subunit